MQEPEIFEQPVASKDPEAHGAGDEHAMYGGAYGGTIYSNGVSPVAARDDESDDYRDFVFPEGWSCPSPSPLRVWVIDTALTLQFVLFAISTGNSISFSSYLLHAATKSSQEGTWMNQGIAIAAITVVCLIHAFAPRWGIWLSNGFGAFKLVMLSLLVCTGFAALAGRTATPRPDNFSSFHGAGSSRAPDDNPAGAAGGYSIALLQVLYSYSGWENANYVLTEFAAMSKIEIANAKTVVAAKFFENVWGESSFVTRVVPLFIGLSALGNAFAQSFAMPRVKQELSKEGVLPFSRFWASDWPFNAPSGAIFLHWIFTVIFILGCRTPDVYSFVTNVFIYSGNWIKLFLALGLVYLNFAPSERWAEQRTTFRSSPLLTIFWILSLLFVQVAPFIDNDFLLFVPYYVFPTLGTSLLVIGTGYWLVWAKVLPAFGYHIQHEIVQMPDGSERVKYKRVKPKKRKKPGQWTRQRKRSVW
ncbi:hypothetical protein CHGG_03360 [Chaetomium globosum CBS 148.51]|uniref:Amino acid permease/ SLC12A domain-containing protein n=1 Tax=Chaetomium globosum (strain ATCC 6205 / CBS 148.51 / DSM 1962 / NBRC 6347 / NRRL 1970) TaxID=306901 RepID=Q2H8U4_CHAGB|nr:uncharacterized protein CHGG_03360 [Chaetomium globosum CBS 148.51]EAQ91425.1 hypothetical protein CHGG_03360 [Chaetomium globosum CBS 148.51]